MLNKNNIESLFQGKNNNLELGCGPSKKEGYIGIDSIDYSCVDICGDVFEILNVIPDGSCNAIYASHFFCHIKDWERLLNECSRILCNNGSLNIVNPHFSNPFFFSDPTHIKTCGLYSFSYYAIDNMFHRKVPLYANTGFTLNSYLLVFKAPKPFYISYLVGKFFTKIFNVSCFISELYEWHLSKYISCYEVRFNLQKVK
jgi:SAM-dependent methyltransferase